MFVFNIFSFFWFLQGSVHLMNTRLSILLVKVSEFGTRVCLMLFIFVLKMLG